MAIDIDIGSDSSNPSAFFNFPQPSVINPSTSGENKLACGFNLGTSNTNGTTGCGLYAILRAAYDNLIDPAAAASGSGPTNLFFNNLDCFALPPSEFSTANPIFVISDGGTLISALNELHNHINYLIFRVDYNRTDPSPVPQFNTTGELISQNLKAVRQYNFYTNYLFYGSYSGENSVNPNSAEVFAGVFPPGDLRGNGITAAFAFSSVSGDGTIDPRQGHASRAGIELFTILNYLKYSGIAVIAGSYEDLYKIKDKQILSPPELDPEAIGQQFLIVKNGLDCILTLENTSMLTGVNATSSSNDDAMIYGGGNYAASNSTGLTIYNLTQGLLPENLGNSFCGNGFRGNLFSSILAKNEDPDTFMIFHAGLSGLNFAYGQNFEDTPENAFRHPSTDGFSFLYRERSTNSNFNASPSVVSGVLNNNQIQRLCCVTGKTLYRFFWTENGVPNGTVIGGGDDGSLWIPCLDLVEFVGMLNWVKDGSVSGQLFESNIGSEYQIPPITFLPQPPVEKTSSTRYSTDGTEYTTLTQKRINVLSTSGYFPSDLVGTTGTVILLRNRRNVENIYSFAYVKAKEAVNLFTGGNFINNTETRQQVINEITAKYEAVSFNEYLKSPYEIICNNSNNSSSNSQLTVEVRIKPKVSPIPGSGLPLVIQVKAG